MNDRQSAKTVSRAHREPLIRIAMRDTVSIGKKIGLSDELVMRHPFPGPGLSINVLCNDGKAKEGDSEELKKAQAELDGVTFTQFCENCSQSLRRSVLPVRSVGVQGDFRTYRFPAVLTFKSEEGADESAKGFFHLPKKWEKLDAASVAITNSARYINRCVIKLWQNPAISDSDLSLQEGYCDKRRLDQTREADKIVLDALHKSGWYGKIFQHLTINLPYASSADRCTIVLRPVVSEDVMTARFAPLPQDMVKEIVAGIAKLGFVDAVYYDVTNKPPATFGWE